MEHALLYLESTSEARLNRNYFSLIVVLFAGYSLTATADAVSISGYDYCAAQRQKVVQIEGEASPDCKKKVHDGGQCCNGSTSGCYVPPGVASGTAGTKNAGQVTAQANADLAGNLGKQKTICDNSETDAVVACKNSAQDKDYEKKYRKAEGDLSDCLSTAQGESNARAVAGGATANTSDSAPTGCTKSGLHTSAEIIACLSNK